MGPVRDRIRIYDNHFPQCMHLIAAAAPPQSILPSIHPYRQIKLFVSTWTRLRIIILNKTKKSVRGRKIVDPFLNEAKLTYIRQSFKLESASKNSSECLFKNPFCISSSLQLSYVICIIISRGCSILAQHKYEDNHGLQFLVTKEKVQADLVKLEWEMYFFFPWIGIPYSDQWEAAADDDKDLL